MSSAPALSRGLHILELVKKENELSFKKIQEITEINSSSLTRILNVLVNKGYLKKNRNKNYIIGEKLLILAEGSSLLDLISREAEDILNEISTVFKVTACLHGFTNKGSIMLNKKIHQDNVALREIGEIKKDLILSPWGFLYIAEKDDPVSFIKKIKKNEWYDLSPPSEGDLVDLIEKAKKRGYADDEGIIIEGVRRLAVPLYNSNNELVATLGLGTIQDLIKGQDKISEIINFLKIKREILSKKV